MTPEQRPWPYGDAATCLARIIPGNANLETPEKLAFRSGLILIKDKGWHRITVSMYPDLAQKCSDGGTPIVTFQEDPFAKTVKQLRMEKAARVDAEKEKAVESNDDVKKAIAEAEKAKAEAAKAETELKKSQADAEKAKAEAEAAVAKLELRKAEVGDGVTIEPEKETLESGVIKLTEEETLEIEKAREAASQRRQEEAKAAETHPAVAAANTDDPEELDDLLVPGEGEGEGGAGVVEDGKLKLFSDADDSEDDFIEDEDPDEDDDEAPVSPKPASKKRKLKTKKKG